MMIDGITVLEATSGGIYWLYFFLAIVAILMTIAFILIYKDNHDKAMIAGLIIAITMAITSIYFVFDCYAPTYKVLIDPSVSFIDFNNNYELINHNNNSLIYTIKEKNLND